MSFMLRKSQERPAQRPAPRVAPASIIAVASGKGGVGKTFMAITLASAFAQAGKRTLLVDGDLGLANVDVQLGIAPETDLAAVIAGWVELDDAVNLVGNPLEDLITVGNAPFRSDEFHAGCSDMLTEIDRMEFGSGASVRADHQQ